jgi:hypothetical protein
MRATDKARNGLLGFLLCMKKHGFLFSVLSGLYAMTVTVSIFEPDWPATRLTRFNRQFITTFVAHNREEEPVNHSVAIVAAIAYTA